MSDGCDPKRRRLIESCSVCRINRLRCEADCVFRQYFPPGTEAEYAAVLRFFGHTNFTKRVISAREAGAPANDPAVRANRQHAAATSIIFEALARANDPVFGCYRIISDLQSYTNSLEAELKLVTDRLEHYRSSSSKVPIDSDTTASTQGVEPNSLAKSGPREWSPQELRRFYYQAPDLEQIMKDARYEPLIHGEINLPSFQGLVPHSSVTAYKKIDVAKVYDDLLGPVNVGHGYELGQSSQEFQEYQDQNDPLEVNVPTTASSVSPFSSFASVSDVDKANCSMSQKKKLSLQVDRLQSKIN